MPDDRVRQWQPRSTSDSGGPRGPGTASKVLPPPCSRLFSCFSAFVKNMGPPCKSAPPPTNWTHPTGLDTVDSGVVTRQYLEWESGKRGGISTTITARGYQRMSQNRQNLVVSVSWHSLNKYCAILIVYIVVWRWDPKHILKNITG